MQSYTVNGIACRSAEILPLLCSMEVDNGDFDLLIPSLPFFYFRLEQPVSSANDEHRSSRNPL